MVRREAIETLAHIIIKLITPEGIFGNIVRKGGFWYLFRQAASAITVDVAVAMTATSLVVTLTVLTNTIILGVNTHTCLALIIARTASMQR